MNAVAAETSPFYTAFRGQFWGIRSWEQHGIRYRECVSCDFFEQLPIEDEAAPELTTRVNQPREEQTRQDIQPVRILDPKGR